MRSSFGLASLAVIFLGVGGGCTSGPAAESPDDCVRNAATTVPNVDAEASRELDVDVEQQAITRLQLDPDWRAQKIDATRKKKAEKRRAELANRPQCPAL